MLLVVRHAETDLNKLDCYQGLIDSSLSEKGIEEAVKIGNFLMQNFSLKDFNIVCSPQKRCLATVNFALNNIYKFSVSGLLIEQSYGFWEGLTKQEVQETYPKQWEEFELKKEFFAAPFGESFEQAKLRAKEWLHFNYLKDPSKNYLIFTHKKISIAIRQLLFPQLATKDHFFDQVFEMDILSNRFKTHQIGS